MEENPNEETVIPSFENRFNIKTDIDQARIAFINRVENMIVRNLFLNYRWIQRDDYTRKIKWRLANRFGEKFNPKHSFAFYHGDDFYRCLRALEIAYKALPKDSQKNEIASIIIDLINNSELDLGITWQNGAFWASGVKQLDKPLINENLQWLSQHGYETVLDPFQKGLSHFLDSINKSTNLSDVITDMYESLEAMGKIVLKNNKDLSANKEKFISFLKLNKYYSKMLGDFIEYANEYRHGAEAGTQKPPLRRDEVEAFIYMTGLFIRLATQHSESIS